MSERNECKYVFKKGPNKGKICKVINCKLHKTHKSIEKHTQTKNEQSLPLQNPLQGQIVTVSVSIPDNNNNNNNNSQKKDHRLEPKQENTARIEKVIKKRLENEENIKDKILQLDTSIENKTIIMKHYQSIKKLDYNSSEYYKNQLFIDQTLSIPWNKFYNIRDFIGIKEQHENKGIQFHIENKILIKNFIEKFKQELDNEIFGMNNVKNEIINYVCKFITNPFSQKNNIALYGSAGVCKTKFVKILSKILGLKMKVISLGGMKDSSYLLGHHFTYQESQCGAITQSIIESQIMNPILYFDELDKVSNSEHGQDIYSVLANITDPTINCNFKDHYFSHLNIDLSKVFYIFTFNDISKVNKILLDRLNVIYIENPSKKDKITILKSHCLNEIIENIGLGAFAPQLRTITGALAISLNESNKKQININFTDSCYNKIIEYTDKNIDLKVSSGIRESVRILEKILLEINKELLLDDGVMLLHDKTLVISDTSFNNYFEKLKPQFIFLLNDDSPPLHMYI
jgi:ATP-dependent Lon protease